MITRHGRPAGYLIGYEALNRLLDRLENMEDLYWMYQGLAEYRAGEGRPFEEFVAELESREQQVSCGEHGPAHGAGDRTAAPPRP